MSDGSGVEGVSSQCRTERPQALQVETIMMDGLDALPCMPQQHPPPHTHMYASVLGASKHLYNRSVLNSGRVQTVAPDWLL
jgi:hypothetical protein